MGANPNLIITLGNTALWALSGSTGISKVRGTTYLSTFTVGDFKCLSTYNPAAIFKQYELRPTIIMDFVKAARESQFPEIRRPNCEIWIEPSLENIATFIDQYVRTCDLLSVDIETSGTRVTCIGFAPRADLAIVIPFDDPRKEDQIEAIGANTKSLSARNAGTLYETFLKIEPSLSSSKTASTTSVFSPEATASSSAVPRKIQCSSRTRSNRRVSKE